MSAPGVSRVTERGSAVLLALIFVVVAGSIIGFQAYRYRTLLQVHTRLNYLAERQDWAAAIGERIDCDRLILPFTRTTKCPSGTPRTLTFFGEAPLLPNGPQGSYALNSQWYAKLECGTSSLSTKIAKFKDGSFYKDPQTGQTIDFDHPSAKISDGPGLASFCSEYFSGEPKVRLFSMSIDTLQEKAFRLDPNGETKMTSFNCKYQTGILSELNTFPLKSYYRKNGDPNVRNAWAEKMFTDIGTANLDYSHQWPAIELLNTPTHLCYLFCADRGYNAGFHKKCDDSSPSVSIRGSWKEDDDLDQAVCLCFK